MAAIGVNQVRTPTGKVLPFRLMRVGRRALLLLLAVGGVACTPPRPYVRYDGQTFGKAKPAEKMEVLRTGPPAPPARYQDLGMVVVTCPSTMHPTGFGPTTPIGGCNYLWAVRQACERAASVGADGIHSIESSANSTGAIVSLRASTFVRLPPQVSPAAAAPSPQAKPQPTVQDRLRQLEELKKAALITPDEYAKKRAEIIDEI